MRGIELMDLLAKTHHETRLGANLAVFICTQCAAYTLVQVSSGYTHVNAESLWESSFLLSSWKVKSIFKRLPIDLCFGQYRNHTFYLIKQHLCCCDTESLVFITGEMSCGVQCILYVLANIETTCFT